MIEAFRRFLKTESASGLIMLGAAVIAMILANSPLNALYHSLLTMPVEVRIGALHLDKNLLLWINDGLMAIFFFLVGLELKREAMEGELSRPDQIILPGVAAIGGMIVPALIYLAINFNDPVGINGWAIPAATDIAFALSIMALLGKRVPVSLKVFLVALAILDDIGAIIIIALFYTSKLSLGALGVAAGCCLVLFALNRKKICTMTPYILVTIVMWVAVLKSGVHATLAGVVAAMFIPMSEPAPSKNSPLKNLEHSMHGTVSFFVLPVFAFANAGVQILGVPLSSLVHSVPVGVCLGLLIGKPLGIMLFSKITVASRLAHLPEGATWSSLFGTSMLCGIGFTMSLFIGGLAFENVGAERVFDERVGILLGSLISGVVGYLFLKMNLSKNTETST